MDAPYLPGNAPPPQHPLSRYLPALPAGLLASAPLLTDIPPGSWLLFPFGESPSLAIEAAALGYRVLVITSNPILAFLHRALTVTGDPLLWQNALARLSAARLLEHRLEPYILSHYLTPCPSCGNLIPAQAFLWRKNAPAPHARLITCPHCHTSGLHTNHPADSERLAPLQRSAPLHYARALQLVTPPGDDLRPQAEAALRTLFPRPLSLLFTLLNQAQQLSLPEPIQLRLQALLLYACDRTSSLWPHPYTHARPTSLTPPPVFTEWNLWLALEEGLTAWQQAAHPLPCTTWPELPPPQGGICIYPARLREAAQHLPDLHPAAVIAPLPRPNPAFWKQAILWSAWLWGRAAIGPWKPILRRYRYTWDWQTALLTNAWRALLPAIPKHTPFLILLDEDHPAFARTALLSAQAGGLHIHALALRPEQGIQIHARPAGTSPPAPPPHDLPAFLRSAARQHLTARAESAPGHILQIAALDALVRPHQHLAAIAADISPEQASRRIKAALRAAFASPHEDFHTAPEHSPNPITARFWLTRQPLTPSLADHAEIALVHALHHNPGASLPQLETTVCASLPGLLTPEQPLLRTILTSYAVTTPQGGYRLREEDTPKNRRADLLEIAARLEQIAARLKLPASRSNQDPPIVTWETPSAAVIRFHIIASALLAKTITRPIPPADQPWIVIPGSRADLLRYKLHRDPALQAAIQAGRWQFIKYRHVRRLSADSTLNLENLFERLALDPLTSTSPQLPLF
ncbi:MAG: hypothetical protein Fur0018_03850 [Anaerolineales bacterium]